MTVAGQGPALEPLSRERIEHRLKELRSELAAGQQRLLDLNAEQSRVREAVLRIDGAILAMEELLGEGAAANGGGGTR